VFFKIFMSKKKHYEQKLWMSCVTFCVVLRRMLFNSRRFGTLCLFHLHRRVDAKWVMIEFFVFYGCNTQCSETSTIKHHTPESNPKGYTWHKEYGESFKSRIYGVCFCLDWVIVLTLHFIFKYVTYKCYVGYNTEVCFILMFENIYIK
jgi:hypothetical protein